MMRHSVGSRALPRGIVAIAALLLIAPHSWAALIVDSASRTIDSSGSAVGTIRVGDFAPPTVINVGPYTWTDSDAAASASGTFSSTVYGEIPLIVEPQTTMPVVYSSGSATQDSTIGADSFSLSGNAEVVAYVLSQFNNIGISYDGAVAAESSSFFDVFFELTDAYTIDLSGSLLGEGSSAGSGFSFVTLSQGGSALASFTADGDDSVDVSYSAMLLPGVYELEVQAFASYSGSDFGDASNSFDLTMAFCPAVPEPATLLLFGVGLCGMVATRIRRRR